MKTTATLEKFVADIDAGRVSCADVDRIAASIDRSRAKLRSALGDLSASEVRHPSQPPARFSARPAVPQSRERAFDGGRDVADASRFPARDRELDELVTKFRAYDTNGSLSHFDAIAQARDEWRQGSQRGMSLSLHAYVEIQLRRARQRAGGR